jgi:carnitine 3-dehydrogenase
VSAPAAGRRPVAVIGTGVIGASWAAHFLGRGLDVVASDPAPGAHDRLRAAVAETWPVLERIGLARGASPQRLTFTDDPTAAVADAMFVQENAVEDLGLKQELIRLLDDATPADAVIASSSSAIRPTDLQARCTRSPERVLVGHPFHPPHLTPLVEVVGGRRTAEGCVVAALEFYRTVAKEPVRINVEVVGHVANRLQAALWREAFSLVDKGVVSVADLDTTIASGPGLRWAVLGPFATLALTGGDGGLAHVLDHLGPAMTGMWDDFTTPDLDEALCRKVIDGVREEADRLGTAASQQARDALLVEILDRKRSASAGRTS